MGTALTYEHKPDPLRHVCPWRPSQDLALRVDVKAAVSALLAEGQEALAERWAAMLTRSQQIDLVTQAVACDRLKCAASIVRALGLGVEFPNIEAECKNRSVARLVMKQLWGPAAAYVGTDERLQLILLKEVRFVFLRVIRVCHRNVD